MKRTSPAITHKHHHLETEDSHAKKSNEHIRTYYLFKFSDNKLFCIR
jgi:hypothetical protein